MRTISLFLLPVLLVNACATLPPSIQPPMELQTTWDQMPAGIPVEATDSSAAWWQRFNDPTLDELINIAQSRNIDLKEAGARIREARAIRKAANADFFPDLSGIFDATRKDSATTVPTNSFHLGLEASWEADVFGRLNHQAQAAEANLKATEADREAIRLTLLAEVARDYLEYRLRQTQEALAQKTVEARDGTLRITRARFQQGMANRMEVERAVSTLAVARAQVPQARELAASARYRLAFLLASSPEALPPALSSVKPLPDSDALSVLLTPTDVIALRPDVRSAKQRLATATQLRETALALRYPRVTLAGFLGMENSDASELLRGSRAWAFGTNLVAPLLDFGRIRAGIDAADARQEQALLNYERTIRTALQETQSAIVAYAQGVARQKHLSEAVESARVAASLSRKQYVEGTLSLLEVLDADRTLYEVEFSFSQATADVSIRLVTLYKTMGIVPPVASS